MELNRTGHENRGQQPPQPQQPPQYKSRSTRGGEGESLWPGRPPGTEHSQNNNHVQPQLGKQGRTLAEDQNEKPLIRPKDKPWPGRSPTKKDLTISRRACDHPKHQAKKYVGQPINIHQDMLSSGTLQKRTRVGGRAEEMEDSTCTKISNPHHIGDWIPTSGKVTIDQVHQQTRKKMVWHPQQSTDYVGNHNFHQDQEGIVIRTSSGQPLCKYCLIPSHARESCILRREHLSKGIDLLYHPQRGMLKSRNSRRKLAISEEQEYESKLMADETEYNSSQNLSQSLWCTVDEGTDKGVLGANPELPVTTQVLGTLR
jgi:hypothetical protein